MNQEFIDNPLFAAWPFWVLNLSPEANVADIEKSANELIGKLKFGVKEAEIFLTPNGEKTRDEFLIREAKSNLQNPTKRLLAEFWYIDPATMVDEDTLSMSALEWQKKFGVDLWAE